jgi:hypothetical protein
MPHGPLQRVQCAGWLKVSASSHSCDSLLHWAVAWEMMSSERQLEQTGVSRVARVVRRLTIWAGSWFELNGLRSEACVMLFPIEASCDPGADEVEDLSRFAARRVVVDYISAVVEPNPALVSART